MTLSDPSLFAAASRPERPPRASALVADAAETPPLPLLLPEEPVLLDVGGEQAVTAPSAMVAAASVPAVRRRRLGRAGVGDGTWNGRMEGPSWAGPRGAGRLAE